MRDIRPSADDAPERSIRNIHMAHRHSRHAATPPDEYQNEPRAPRRKSSGKGRWWLWGSVVVIVCAAGGVLLSTVFAGATVTVYPKTATVTPPTTIQAQLNAPVGVLAYQSISASKTDTVSAPATGTQHVSIAASGVVTISNSYSTASQRLIANTRFAAPDGKIYRIHDSIVVPGMSGSQPGTVTATLYADSPGADYNKTGTTVFTIPGFKGDPRYSKFSAQSQGGISGGFIGDQPAVAPTDLAAAKSALQKQLDQDVRSAIQAEIPGPDIALPGTLSVTFGNITQAPGSNNTATLSQDATAVGGIIRQSDLAAAIARKTVQGYNGEAVDFGDTSALQATVATTTDIQSGVVTINLSGSAQLVWQFDADALKTALVGKDKSAFQTIIQAFEPALTRADASIRPFWQGTFPSDPSKITITVDTTP